MRSIFETTVDLSIFEPYKINCGKCCGLCCVALYCTKSDGFPNDKEIGTACENLQEDYRCKVHSSLLKRGLKGCLIYDCFGAGQFITQQLTSLPKWSAISQKESDNIFNSYLFVLRIRQTLWYLSQCLILRLPRDEKEQVKSLISQGNAVSDNTLKLLDLSNSNAQIFYEKSNACLKHIGSLYHSTAFTSGSPGFKDYMGKNMRKKNLEGTDFSMSLLIGADLAQANLYGSNFLGADMRDTNICGTDLSQCLFLTQMQINGAKGNKNTKIPAFLQKPAAWDCN